MKYAIVTYGCQMNAHESEKLAGILESAGYARSEPEQADVVVFNTCCIRENAERKAEGNIGALKKLKKSRPGMQIAVVGCMTQQSGAAEKLLAKFPFVDVILGTHNAGRLLSELEAARLTDKSRTSVGEWEESFKDSEDEGIAAKREGKVSAFVNIMYGCDNFCTYCIVPYVRGRERSRSPEGVFAEVRSLLAEGFREITLLGQNVNSYRGTDADGNVWSFSKLLAGLAELPVRYRLKFMTSHPKDFSEELAETVKRYENIAKCIHLPVQSGSTSVLSRMNRRYTREEYLEKINWIKRLVPGCGLTTDLMVGFPGETDEEFEDTLSLCRQVGYTGAFTFVYSRRSGTKADGFEDQIPEPVKKSRIMRLVALQNRIAAEGYSDCLGKTFEVLCEGKDESGERYVGRTEAGRLVLFPAQESDVGKFLRITVDKTGAAALYGNKREGV